MIRFGWKPISFGIIALAAASAGAGIYADTLTVNGKTTSVDVRMVGGSAYVKLADVARALDMSVMKRGAGQYELSKTGGANQVNG